MSLRPLLKGAVFCDVVSGPDTRVLDITDASAVKALLEAEGIDTVVNCAAWTNVEGAEDAPEAAATLNAGAVGILARAMKERGGKLVQISTDYVFGGRGYNVPIREDALPSPLGVYGRTKQMGEEALLASGCRSLILRTAWLYSEYGKNFVKTMLSLTASRPMVKVVFDQVGTPTYAGDLAAAIVKLLEADAEGVFHYSNEGVCSWYDFAVAVAELSGHADCEIRPCHSDEFPSKVMRPAYSVLDKTKIKETFGVSVPYWRDSLKRCLENL